MDTHEKKVEIHDADDYEAMDVREKYVLINRDEEMLSVTTLKYDFPIDSLEELKGIQTLLQTALEMSLKSQVDVAVTSEENNVSVEQHSQENNESAPVEAVVTDETNATAVAPIMVEETNTTVLPVNVETAVQTPAEETTEQTENNTTQVQ